MPDDTMLTELPSLKFTPICAIGASAGGVGALQEVFRRLPDDLGLAYVVILHLAPDHPSALREILGICTHMPVTQVQDSSVLRPDSIYVIAPDTELVIKGDDVNCRPFTEPRGRRAPIDMFFRSVAAARGDGVAMVLSGTGADGSQGLLFVKEAGGVVMVQDPAEAEFATMPQNAIATGMADFVAPIARLTDLLRDVAHSKFAVRSLDMDGVANELRRIIGFLRSRTGHDFSSYKRATVMRRVTRRMQVCRLDSLTAYAEYLQGTPEEAKELFSDLLISVTMFFRDARAFEALSRQVIEPILEEHKNNSRDEAVRTWVVGCATGEEAYSLAILYLEAMRERKLHVPIQIFATDLDEGALATAREGRYPRSIEANVSEAADTSASLFATLDREARIYAARPHATQSLPVLPQYPTPERFVLQRPTVPLQPADAQIAVVHHATALEQAGPPSALVDATQNLVHLSPTAGRFIFHSAGQPSNHFPALVRPELRLDLKLALTRALDERRTTLTHPVTVTFDGERRQVSMHVAPVVSRGEIVGQALVSFLAGDVLSPDDEAADAASPRPEEVLRLHAELKSSQEALVASRSGHDATIQDLRATNEELQSTNEEYRSTAEELETSREELQSINEELHTVNAELKSKLEHLSVAHSDLQNLTAVMDVGTLFLDADLRIKMFTTPIVDVFPITKSDVGRSITDFTNRLDHPALVEQAQQVVRELVPFECEVRSTSGRFYVMRMRPYRTVEDRIEGVVLTFVDISSRLKMELALGRSEQQFRALVRASSQVLYRMNSNWTEMRELFGGGFLSTQDKPTMSWLEHYIPAEDRKHVQEVIQRAIDAKSIFNLEHRVVREDGSVGWTHSRAIPILDMNGQIAEWFGSADDVTLQHRAKGALSESEDRLRVLVEGVPQHVWRAEPGGLWTWSSPQWQRYTGLSDVESRDNGWLAAVHPDDRDVIMTAWYNAAGTGVFEVECRLRNIDQSHYRWFRGQATARLDADGRVREWLGTFTDVDDLRMLQGRQEVLLAELQHRVRNIMAVIRSIAARTAENSTTVADYAARLKGRLEALARTQVILTRQAGVGVDLEEIIHDELLAQTSRLDQVTIEGSSVSLSAKAAEVLTLAVHELATNAVKYGALSTVAGTIRVAWTVGEKGGATILALRWTETGISIVTSEPRRKGFGTELITQRVPYELKGNGQLDLLPDGLQALISFPLHSGDSVLQTDALSVQTAPRGSA